MVIAIQPDNYTNPKIGKCDASSPRWADLLNEASHKVRWVDVRRSDILEQIKGCDGFMWRHAHVPQHRQIARRLLPVMENTLGLAVYPDQATCWHYDDKISQYYLLNAAGIPMPETAIWFDYDPAMDYLKNADFPLVIKLWTGAGSENVRLVKNLSEAEIWLKKLFGTGIGSLADQKKAHDRPLGKRLRYATKMLLKGNPSASPWELHKNYCLFQEFIAGNPFDTRITVIGNRAFGYRRFNRPNDFRASGSGNFDTDPTKIDLEMVRLALETAEKLGTQSIAVDGLRRDSQRFITEVSYTYVSWMIQLCPGHWERNGDDLIWKKGQMWPEEAQIQDFLLRLKKRNSKKEKICV